MILLSGILLVILFFYCITIGVEMAITKANHLTLELKRDQRGKVNQNLARILDDPRLFWKTTTPLVYIFLTGSFIIMIMLINRLIQAYAPMSVKEYLMAYPYMLVLGVVCFHLVVIHFIRNFIARPIFHYKPENKINFYSHIIMRLSRIFVPIMNAFKATSEFVLVYLFNARVNKDAPLFEGIFPNKFYRESVQGHSALEALNKEFFRGAVDLTQVSVRKCVTPRIEMVALSVQSSIEDLRKLFIESGHSKIVIYDKHLDNILGYVIHFDLHQNPQSIKDIIQELPKVPETMSALDIIKQFTRERKSMALVVDEFGGTTGIVTTEDVLEEIFGNIKDEYATNEFVEKKISENEYIFSGRLKIEHLNQKYGFNFKEDIAETLSGYVIKMNESIPRNKQKIIIGMYEIEVLLVTETKIESVRLRTLSH